MLSSTHQWSGALIADPVNTAARKRSSNRLESAAETWLIESNDEDEEPMEEAEPTEPIW